MPKMQHTDNKQIQIEDYGYNVIAPDLIQIYGLVTGHAILLEVNGQKCWKFEIKFFKNKARYLVSNHPDCTVHTLHKLKLRVAKAIRRAQ